MKTLLLTLVAVVASAQALNPLRGWWHSQAWLRAVLCLLLLGLSSTQAQCDWSKKIAFAIQRRYQTNEDACKALLASPAEFNQASALQENEMLSHFQFVTDPQLDSWLQQHSQKMLSQFNTQPGQQTVLVDATSEFNAFASGQNVTFHARLVDWYLAPDNVLAQLGYSREQIREFLGQNASLNPGENGIIGILAHETSHNILGHPDVRPLVLACDDFISAGIREVHSYEQVISTGHPGSRFGAFFRSAGFLGMETMFGAERQQQMESDADELGAWLAYRDTGEPAIMSQSLRWLAMYPGAAGTGGVSEVLCSDHPALLNRVNTTAAQAYFVQSGPPQHLFKFPVDATRERYRQFQSWYPQRVEQIQRIAAGNLTPSEAGTTRQVEIEVKQNPPGQRSMGKRFRAARAKFTWAWGPTYWPQVRGTSSRSTDLLS